jgi:hypothetical protein
MVRAGVYPSQKQQLYYQFDPVFTHYYREDHLQRFKTIISCGFSTGVDVLLLISIISSDSRTAANNSYQRRFQF